MIKEQTKFTYQRNNPTWQKHEANIYKADFKSVHQSQNEKHDGYHNLERRQQCQGSFLSIFHRRCKLTNKEA